MNASEREHVMPPRPLMPWTMALCAGMCVSCVMELNVAADALLGEQTSAVGPLLVILLAATLLVVLARFCARRGHRSDGGRGCIGVVDGGCTERFEGARR